MQLVSKISNLCDHNPPTSQTDGQTTCKRCYVRRALFPSTLSTFLQNLKSVDIPVPEIIGVTPKIWAVPGYAHAPFSPKFLMGFYSSFIRPPGTISSGRAYVLPQTFSFFIFSPRFLRDPSTDRPETLPHGRNLAEFYKLTSKIRKVLP